MRATRKNKVLWISGGAGLLALLSLYYLLDPEAGLFPTCPFYRLTGLYCTGCGSQRALHDLLHLDFAGSLSHNALLIPTVGLLAAHAGNRMFGGPVGSISWKSPLDARRAPLLLLFFVLLFTVCRNIPFEPFRLLAP